MLGGALGDTAATIWSLLRLPLKERDFIAVLFAALTTRLP